MSLILPPSTISGHAPVTTKKRAYRQKKRALNTRQTTDAIFAASIDLWRELPLQDITLDQIAQQANVSVRTILRKFGSKESLFRACFEQDAARIKATRNLADPNDPRHAITLLMEHYEREGDAVLRALAVAHQVDIAAEFIAAGRTYHRAWCERVFSPALPATNDHDYEIALHAFIASTDIYTWKLLRRDKQLSAEHAGEVIWKLVSALITTSQSPDYPNGRSPQ